MFDTLYKLFEGKNAITHVANISGAFAQIITLFESEFAQDHDAKNAAIDSLIAILQEHKNKVQ